MHFVIGILLAFGLFWLVSWLQKQPADERRRWIKNGVLIGIGGILLLLVVTGRLHILAAIGAALLWVLARLPAMVKYYLWLRRMREAQQSSQRGDDPATPPSAPTSSMSVQEARDVLGVTEEATEEDIIDAHRTLMQKLHPDRGGSNWLAARVNAAKDVLLRNRQ